MNLKDYWHPTLRRPLTDAEIKTIELHERLHRDCQRILRGRTSIGLPDHVADAAVEKVLQAERNKA